jgi:hypothetical protein
MGRKELVDEVEERESREEEEEVEGPFTVIIQGSSTSPSPLLSVSSLQEQKDIVIPCVISLSYNLLIRI